MSKKKWIYLDADPLIFEVCEGKFTKMTMFKSEKGSTLKGKAYKEPLDGYKLRFENLVKDIEDEIAVATLGVVKIKGIKVIFSDPETNFRYDLYPEYKGGRSAEDKGPLYYRMRKWAIKKYGCVKGLEADDYVSHYVRKGHVGATLDKDMLRGVAGMWFDTYHSRRTFNTVSELQALHFNYIQTLTGDPVDNIKALPKELGYGMIPMDVLPEGRKRQPFKVTEALAIKLLDEHGWSWDGVLRAYQAKGFGLKEMVLNARLILLNQWSPKKGVKLFKYKLTQSSVK